MEFLGVTQAARLGSSLHRHTVHVRGGNPSRRCMTLLIGACDWNFTLWAAFYRLVAGGISRILGGGRRGGGRHRLDTSRMCRASYRQQYLKQNLKNRTKSCQYAQ